jgi:Fic family protein
VATIDGQPAFLPPPLPTAVDLSRDSVRALDRAALALGELKGAGQWMSNPYLLIRPFLRREAVLSSKIEGTQASLSDLIVFEAEAEVPRSPMPEDVHEVANYVRAVELGLASTYPPTLGLIEELHASLLRGVRGETATPGAFRRLQNWIGQAGSPIEQASYVPPPPAHLDAALEQLESYLGSDVDIPPLVRIALAHYQFEAIHPFLDGNGRVGRLLITLMLVGERLVSQPLLYLSAFFERNRAMYYERLAGMSMHARQDEWITFFLEGVHEQARDAVARARRLFELHRTYQQRLQTARGSALPLRLVDQLFLSPAITVPQARETLGVTYRAAAQHVTRLEDAGILREITGRERNRLYVATEVLSLLESDRAEEI